jgi:hypothetical protein
MQLDTNILISTGNADNLHLANVNASPAIVDIWTGI